MRRDKPLQKTSRPAPVSDGLYIESVISAIEKGSAVSRADIARELGLSRTSVSTIVGTLISLGLVAERPAAAEGRGRPGICLDLDASRWRAIGAEYHSNIWTFVETDLAGRIVRSRSMPGTGSDPDSYLGDLVSGLECFRRESAGKVLPAIGIGAPGLVDCDRGRIIRADDLGWKEVRVAETVHGKLGCEIFLINRNRASGLAEARFGVGRGVHQMVYIGIGTGISAAYMADGRLIHGSSFSAGEIGHITMDTDGPVCACGKRGCLHVYSSGRALGDRAAGFIAEGRLTTLSTAWTQGQRIPGEAICAASASGDEVALDCLRESGRYLGIAVANIVTSFNPDMVILGGPIGSMESPLIDIVAAEASRWAMSHPFAAVRICRGILGDSAGALGGACLVLDHKIRLAATALDSRN